MSNETEKTFKERVSEQIANNLYSMIIETVIMLLIASYAIYEIRQVKHDVTEKVNRSHQALAEYSKAQAEKLAEVTEELNKTTALLASAVGVTIEDYKANRQEVYQHVQQGGKQVFKDYLKAKFGKEDEINNTKDASLNTLPDK